MECALTQKDHAYPPEERPRTLGMRSASIYRGASRFAGKPVKAPEVRHLMRMGLRTMLWFRRVTRYEGGRVL